MLRQPEWTSKGLRAAGSSYGFGSGSGSALRRTNLGCGELAGVYRAAAKCCPTEDRLPDTQWPTRTRFTLPPLLLLILANLTTASVGEAELKKIEPLQRPIDQDSARSSRLSVAQ